MKKKIKDAMSRMWNSHVPQRMSRARTLFLQHLDTSLPGFDLGLLLLVQACPSSDRSGKKNIKLAPQL